MVLPLTLRSVISRNVCLCLQAYGSCRLIRPGHGLRAHQFTRCTSPSSSPVYNVAYVTQTGNPDGTGSANSRMSAHHPGAPRTILADGGGCWSPPSCYGGFYYPYPRHTLAHYCRATVVILQRLTMIPLQRLQWNRLLSTYRSGTEPDPDPYTAAIPSRSFRHLIDEAAAQHITRTLEPMLRPNTIDRTWVTTCREEQERHHRSFLDSESKQWHTDWQEKWLQHKSGNRGGETASSNTGHNGDV